MKIAHLIGRILLGGFFTLSALTNLMNFQTSVGYAQSMGVPLTSLAVLVAMLLLLIGGLSMLTGFQPVIGITAIAIFFIFVTPMMHAFWKVPDPLQSQIQMRFFLENIGLLGSALMFLAIPLPWPYSLGSKAANASIEPAPAD